MVTKNFGQRHVRIAAGPTWSELCLGGLSEQTARGGPGRGGTGETTCSHSQTR
jgi:hypothetical protein